MRKILTGIYLERDYSGVDIGVLALEDGIMFIDSPLLAEDAHLLMTKVKKFGAGSKRQLIYLDSHPDRTLGARNMNSMVLAHHTTADVFAQRPAVFKAQHVESGSEWEELGGLSGIRWLPPHMNYTKKMKIQWGKFDVFVEHHPGPERGASWVVLPNKGVVFVGDAVVCKQAPFFANADLQAWEESLNLLLSKEYRDYKIITSRSGLVDINDIKILRKLVANTHKNLSRLAKRKSASNATEKLIAPILKTLKCHVKNQEQYSNRLRHGLKSCFGRFYYPGEVNTD